MEATQTLKTELSCYSSIPQLNWSQCELRACLYYTIIHGSKARESTEVSVNTWMFKENVSHTHTHNGVLFRLVSEISSLVTMWMKWGDVLFDDQNHLSKEDISLNVVCVRNLTTLNSNRYRVEQWLRAARETAREGRVLDQIARSFIQTKDIDWDIVQQSDYSQWKCIEYTIIAESKFQLLHHKEMMGNPPIQ